MADLNPQTPSAPNAASGSTERVTDDLRQPSVPVPTTPVTGITPPADPRGSGYFRIVPQSSPTALESVPAGSIVPTPDPMWAAQVRRTAAERPIVDATGTKPTLTDDDWTRR